MRNILVLLLASLLLFGCAQFDQFSQFVGAAGSPIQFGNNTTTTCTIGGDLGMLNCSGALIGKNLTLNDTCTSGQVTTLQNGVLTCVASSGSLNGSITTIQSNDRSIVVQNGSTSNISVNTSQIATVAQQAADSQLQNDSIALKFSIAVQNAFSTAENITWAGLSGAMNISIGLMFPRSEMNAYSTLKNTSDTALSQIMNDTLANNYWNRNNTYSRPQIEGLSNFTYYLTSLNTYSRAQVEALQNFTYYLTASATHTLLGQQTGAINTTLADTNSSIYDNLAALAGNKSGIGDCPSGQWTQNLTSGAPQCSVVTVSMSGYYTQAQVEALSNLTNYLTSSATYTRAQIEALANFSNYLSSSAIYTLLTQQTGALNSTIDSKLPISQAAAVTTLINDTDAHQEAVNTLQNQTEAATASQQTALGTLNNNTNAAQTTEIGRLNDSNMSLGRQVGALNISNISDYNMIAALNISNQTVYIWISNLNQSNISAFQLIALLNSSNLSLYQSNSTTNQRIDLIALGGGLPSNLTYKNSTFSIVAANISCANVSGAVSDLCAITPSAGGNVSSNGGTTGGDALGQYNVAIYINDTLLTYLSDAGYRFYYDNTVGWVFNGEVTFENDIDATAANANFGTVTFTSFPSMNASCDPNLVQSVTINADASISVSCVEPASGTSNANLTGASLTPGEFAYVFNLTEVRSTAIHAENVSPGWFPAGNYTMEGTFVVNATLEAELAPEISDINWDTDDGWEIPTTILNKSSDSAGSSYAYPATPITPTVGVTYRVEVDIESTSAGNVWMELGGVAPYLPLTTGANVYYLTAATDARFDIGTVSTARVVITGVSVRALVNGTGDTYVYGNLLINKKIKDVTGSTLFDFAPQSITIGGTGLPVAFTEISPSAEGWSFGIYDPSLIGAPQIGFIPNYNISSPDITGANTFRIGASGGSEESWYAPLNSFFIMHGFFTSLPLTIDENDNFHIGEDTTPTTNDKVHIKGNLSTTMPIYEEGQSLDERYNFTLPIALLNTSNQSLWTGLQGLNASYLGNDIAKNATIDAKAFRADANLTGGLTPAGSIVVSINGSNAGTLGGLNASGNVFKALNVSTLNYTIQGVTNVSIYHNGTCLIIGNASGGICII